jgi:prophage regulatory protein
MHQNSHHHASGRRFLRLNEVKFQVGLGRSAIYVKIKRGEFPAPIKLGGRAVAWISDEIESWINIQIESSRNCQ